MNYNTIRKLSLLGFVAIIGIAEFTILPKLSSRFYNFGQFNRFEIETGINECMQKNGWIDLYGLIQLVLGKKQIENFTIVKTDYAKLVQIREAISTEEAQAEFDELNQLLTYLEETSIPYYYITGLLPIKNEGEIPYGFKENSHKNLELTNSVMRISESSLIDLRSAKRIKGIPKEELFYLTDHHWRLETAFEAYCEVVNRVARDMGIQCNQKRTTDLSNYEIEEYPRSFLGSYGVKVGRYYAGKDDLIIYIPKYETDFSFQGFNPQNEIVVQKQGNFEDTLLDQEILNDVNYNNKYYVFFNIGHGGCEYHVVNNMAPNEKKCLLISHSYGRPVAMYLSNNFAELVNIDPQEGRFNGNYLTFIEEYKPDVVLFLVEFEGEITGNYRTTG